MSPLLVKSAKANSTESLQELLTSDSDGSCMGAGSPRDMQSPVFDIRTEVIFTFDLFSLLTSTTVVGYHLKISSNYLTSCIVKSTQCFPVTTKTFKTVCCRRRGLSPRRPQHQLPPTVFRPPLTPVNKSASRVFSGKNLKVDHTVTLSQVY